MSSSNTCVCCGETIPEGRMICINCENQMTQVDEGVKSMTFDDFVEWCRQRSVDGYWGRKDALVCATIIETIRRKPFNKRERVWKNRYRDYTVSRFVNPINEKIKTVYLYRERNYDE